MENMVRDEYYAHNQKAMRELNALPLPQLLPTAHPISSQTQFIGNKISITWATDEHEVEVSCFSYRLNCR